MKYQSLPAELFHKAEEQHGRIRWVRFKKDGRWHRQDHRATRTRAMYLSCALKALGHGRGDRVGIVSRTRLEWTIADLSILAAGMITTGIYETSTTAQCAFILNHAEVATCFVEDVVQAEKIMEAAASVPSLKRIVLFTGTPPSSGPAGVETLTLDRLVEIGKAEHERDPEWFRKTMDAITPDDTAIIVYTSGTTGEPKGVVLTHKAIQAVIEGSRKALQVGEGDLGISYLPLAHILQRTSNYFAMETGVNGSYAESIEKLVENLHDIRPTTMSAVPRIFEKIHARVMSEVEKAGPNKKAIFDWAIGVGGLYNELKVIGSVSLGMRIRHRIADRLVLHKIRDVFGGRIRFIASGGAPLSVDLIRFFDAAGVTILEGYGLTETAAPCAVNRLDRRKPGTVGLPLDGIEIKIAPDGEILVRGDSVFKEYYKDPMATREAFDDEGFFRTGDIGELDADGFLRITDRKKDLIITAGGKNIAPAPIENELKASGYICQAVVIGDRRKFLSALIALDHDEIATWAKRRRLPLEGLFVNPETVSMIWKFRILPGELTIASGEVTPTMKIRRKVVEERYRDLIDEMYVE
jgi:long-chain acyl-CoA synthetase